MLAFVSKSCRSESLHSEFKEKDMFRATYYSITDNQYSTLNSSRAIKKKFHVLKKSEELEVPSLKILLEKSCG